MKEDRKGATTDSETPAALPKKNVKVPSEDSASYENSKNTIFVGNLPNTIKSNELKKLFRKFGFIHNARLRCAARKELKIPKKLAVIKRDFHKDSSHISAFIRFKNFDSCKNALRMNGKLVEGRHIRVTLAEDKGKSDSKKSIFLGNVPFNTQDDDLWDIFQDCGAIENVRLVRDEKTGIGKGFGYVNFKSIDSVELALKLDGITMLNREIRVRRIGDEGKPKATKAKTKNDTVNHRCEPKTVYKKTPRKSKTLNTAETKHEFQGQKSKSTKVKKKQKKGKLNKKKLAIKQIAEKMTKK